MEQEKINTITKKESNFILQRGNCERIIDCCESLITKIIFNLRIIYLLDKHLFYCVSIHFLILFLLSNCGVY